MQTDGRNPQPLQRCAQGELLLRERRQGEVDATEADAKLFLDAGRDALQQPRVGLHSLD